MNIWEGEPEHLVFGMGWWRMPEPDVRAMLHRLDLPARPVLEGYNPIPDEYFRLEVGYEVEQEWQLQQLADGRVWDDIAQYIEGAIIYATLGDGGDEEEP